MAIINSTLFSYWQVETSPKANRKLFPTLLMETIENLPIREATVDLQKAFIEVVDNITKKIFYLQQAQTQFTDLLQSKFEIGNLSVKLQNWYGLDFKDLLKELKKSRVQITLSDSAEWMQFFKEQKQKVQDLKMEIDKIEKEIDQMVYALYELTPEEIAIVESQS